VEKMKSDCDGCFKFKEIEVVDEYGLEYCKDCSNKKSDDDVEFENESNRKGVL